MHLRQFQAPVPPCLSQAHTHRNKIYLLSSLKYLVRGGPVLLVLVGGGGVVVVFITLVPVRIRGDDDDDDDDSYASSASANRRAHQLTRS